MKNKVNNYLNKLKTKGLTRLAKNTLFTAVFDSAVVKKLRENKKSLFAATVLISGTVIAHILNLFFSIYLYRNHTVSLNTISIISLFTSFFSLINVPISSIQAALTHQTAILDERFGKSSAFMFFSRFRSKALFTSLFITFLWIASTAPVMQFFKLDSYLPVILFAPILFFSLAYSIDRGYMSGKLMFSLLGFLVIIEPLIKLLTALLLVAVNLNEIVYLAIPISFIGSTFIGWIILPKIKLASIKNQKENISKTVSFPYKFFSASMLSGLSTVGFLSFDVLLANHYLSSVDAGKYALVSLVGKMVYFLGGLSAQFVLPLVSRYEGKNKNSLNVLYLSLLFTGLLSLIGFIFFALMSKISLPILLAAKAEFVYPFVIPFSIGMLCFTLSHVFVSYYLGRKIYIFPLAAFLLTFVQIILITYRHSSLPEFISNMSILGILHLVLVVVMHFGLIVKGNIKGLKISANLKTFNLYSPAQFKQIFSLVKGGIHEK